LLTITENPCTSSVVTLACRIVKYLGLQRNGSFVLWHTSVHHPSAMSFCCMYHWQTVQRDCYAVTLMHCCPK